ncbi:hypothetical protein CPB85DRAFT_1331859 [Mucidula mucida]|nr:hypothetical protein CPB85DRAFT_1331859 [Mucidula mucida]
MCWHNHTYLRPLQPNNTTLRAIASLSRDVSSSSCPWPTKCNAFMSRNLTSPFNRMDAPRLVQLGLIRFASSYPSNSISRSSSSRITFRAHPLHMAQRKAITTSGASTSAEKHAHAERIPRLGDSFVAAKGENNDCGSKIDGIMIIPLFSSQSPASSLHKERHFAKQ